MRTKTKWIIAAVAVVALTGVGLAVGQTPQGQTYAHGADHAGTSTHGADHERSGTYTHGADHPQRAHGPDHP